MNKETTMKEIIAKEIENNGYYPNTYDEKISRLNRIVSAMAQLVDKQNEDINALKSKLKSTRSESAKEDKDEPNTSIFNPNIDAFRYDEISTDDISGIDMCKINALLSYQRKRHEDIMCTAKIEDDCKYEDALISLLDIATSAIESYINLRGDD